MKKRAHDSVLEVHHMFVAGIKAAVQKLHGSLPDPSKVSPRIVGARPLSFTMPPMMEEAFGYRGSLRFVEFSFSPKTRRFGHSDGGDHVPSDEKSWLHFVKHPLVLVELAVFNCPTLFGEFGPPTTPACGRREQVEELLKRELGKWHCLLFDRHNRQPYLCTREQMILFFPLTEPDDTDDHKVFANGLLLSAGSEGQKAEPSDKCGEQLIAWLDEEAAAIIGSAGNL